MTFGAWLDHWYQSDCKPAIRPKTQADYENRIYQHIIPEIGHIPLVKLTSGDLQQFYIRLKQGGRLLQPERYGPGLSDRMVKTCHVTCCTALDKAVSQGLLLKNPAAAWATQAGIVLGNGSGQFLPDTPVTREQALIMLLRYDIARGAGPVGAWAVGIPYTDAAKGSAWASEALMWNVIRGYLPPDDAGRLNPQSILTREQLEYAISQLGK